MPACEYCGDHFPKGGAHSTHERNCNERPDPGGDDVDETAPIGGEDVTEPEVDGASEGEDENVLEFQENEFEEMLETVRVEAYADGRTEVAEMDADPEGDGETSEETDGSQPDVCPCCGTHLLDGDAVAEELAEMADHDANAAAFLAANDGADPDYVCANMGACSYYVEDGDAKQFATPGGGGGLFGWLVAGVLFLGALVAGGLKSQQNRNNGGPDVF